MSPPNSVPPGSDETTTFISPPPNDSHLQPTKEENESISPSTEENTPLETANDEDDTTSSNDAEVVVPPDGGWGWMVVFASFMCNMIVDGIIFSFGLFLVDISTTFNVTKSQVTLVGSLMSGFYLIAGPFASAVANRFGFRLVAIFGSFLATVAFIISYFATSVEYLYVSYGIIGGIGFGFIYVPAVITIGFYFEKWRALATGVGVCGSGIGTFLFAPMTAWLIKSFGWKNTLLWQGGIVLLCAIFGIVYRPLKPTKVKDIANDEDEEKQELKMDINELPKQTKHKMEQALKGMHENADNQSSINRMLGVNNNANYPRISDVYHTVGVRPTPKYLSVLNQQKRLSVPHVFENGDNAEGKQSLLEKRQNALIVPGRKRTHSQSNNDRDINRPMYRDDIFFGASLTRLPQYTSTTSIAYNMSVTRMPTKTDIEEEKHSKSCKMCPEAVRRTLATMLDYSLLKSPSFLLLAFGGFFTMMGFYVPFMYLSDRAVQNGMATDTAVLLISSIGVANTIGRVLCGVVSSFPGVNALFITNVALTIGGIATIFSGFSSSSEFQFFYTVIFGLAISTFASLRSIIVVDLLGLEKLTNAFGLLLLFQGVAAAIGAPLAGAFMDAAGSYDASFYLSGSMLLASAVMCYPLNWINKWETNKKNKDVSVIV